LVTDHLRRSLAPVRDAAWAAIEDEAAQILRHYLSARPLVDVEGPLGWHHAARTTGHADRLGSITDGVEGWCRRVKPVIELRAHFTMSMDELDAIDRGAPNPDLGPVTK